jgi:Ca2+-binding RTX toxin-like protein
VTVDLGAGQSSGAEGFDTLTSIEAVEGSGFGDILIGDGESNTLTGGFGADTVTGGGGPDNFTYDAASEGGDTIMDLEAANVFLFNRAGFGLGATGTTLGEVGAVFRTGAGLTSADAASPSFIYDTDTGRLLFGADGNGATNAPVLIATLANGFALTADDLRFF